MAKDVVQDTVKISLVRSLIGVRKSHRATIKGLGLRKINSWSILARTPENIGMINKIRYLIRIN